MSYKNRSKNNFANQPESFKKLKWPTFKRTDNKLTANRMKDNKSTINKAKDIKSKINRTKGNRAKDVIPKYIGMKDIKPQIQKIHNTKKDKNFTLVFEVEQKEDAFTNIITMISQHRGNILTLNKGFPVDGISSIFILFDITNLDIEIDILLTKLKAITGVRKMIQIFKGGGVPRKHAFLWKKPMEK